MITISYFTKNTPYEEVMKTHLLASLKKYKLNYDIEGIDDLGSWQKNTHYKAEFIKKMLLKHKCPVIFLDADATIEQYPKLFNGLMDYDISYHSLDWCYDKKTEVYTNNGWKKFKHLNKKDKIATLNVKTKELEFQNYTKFIKYNYKGKMYSFKHGQVDLLVTPNHRMIYQKDNGKKEAKNVNLINIQPASELYKNQRFWIPRTAKWKGKKQNFFNLPSYYNCYGKKGNISYNKPEIKIPIKLWIKFLAWYLSEGCCNNSGQVNVGQSKCSPYSQEIKKVFSKMSKYLSCTFSIYDYPNKVLSYNLFSIQLANYLKKFGKSHDKFISRNIKQLPSNLLRLFLITYIKGDGSFRKRGGFCIYTSSKLMVKDLEGLILKAGWTSSIRISKSGFGKKIYLIYIRIRQKVTIRRHHKKITTYKGKVYCVTVPNGVIYVRREEGKQCWSGNCMQWRGVSGTRREILSGTLYLNYNEKVLKFLNEWININKTNAQLEQKNMAIALKKCALIAYPLPCSYITFPRQDGSLPPNIKKEDIVILHHQVSRKYKDRRKW